MSAFTRSPSRPRSQDRAGAAERHHGKGGGFSGDASCKGSFGKDFASREVGDIRKGGGSSYTDVSSDPWATGSDPWAKAAFKGVKGGGYKGCGYGGKSSSYGRRPMPSESYISLGNWHLPPEERRDVRRGKGYGGGYGGGYRSEVEDVRRLEVKPEAMDPSSLRQVRKDFWVVPHEVRYRPKHESETIRMKNAIHISNLSADWEVPHIVETFGEAGLPEYMLNVALQKGFERPTRIQMQVWPAALSGHDVVGISETGSGKTLAYAIPMLVHVKAQERVTPDEGPIGLVIAMTRELCMQVCEEINVWTPSSDDHAYAIAGGDDYSESDALLRGKTSVLVATPQRMLSVVRAGRTDLKRTSFIVIDEADALMDEMLMQATHEIKSLMEYARPPTHRQMLMFSATWTDKLESAVKEHLRCSPLQIIVGSTRPSACKTIRQCICPIPGKAGKTKRKALEVALKNLESTKPMADDSFEEAKVLIFVSARDMVDVVVSNLRQTFGESFPCDGFVGEQGQNGAASRMEKLKRFMTKQSNLQYLVGTDVLGRGLDMECRVTHVINYDMPTRIFHYIHRIGRTGRAGRSGHALTFFTPEDNGISQMLVSCMTESGQPPTRHLLETASEIKKKKRERYREEAKAAAEPTPPEVLQSQAAAALDDYASATLDA
eukprot:TRINITY_DN36462_c0_g1_i3.p1 TRINITY_DN36462_c0_g1~~TRINITY_DN36462_c0_g1_i3.p1  ORF type:complete len:662 (+),score=159.67 TRINITY_DN36462_c0_g1_i3:62-2047(+)